MPSNTIFLIILHDISNDSNFDFYRDIKICVHFVHKSFCKYNSFILFQCLGTAITELDNIGFGKSFRRMLKTWQILCYIRQIKVPYVISFKWVESLLFFSKIFLRVHCYTSINSTLWVFGVAPRLPFTNLYWTLNSTYGIDVNLVCIAQARFPITSLERSKYRGTYIQS